jgi:hypothetical protein
MTPRTSTCHQQTIDFYARIKALFLRAYNITQEWLDDHVVQILQFVQGVKTVLDNPVLEGTIEALIPRVTPQTFAVIDTVFDKVIEGLQIEIACKSETDLLSKVKCVATYLSTLEPELKDALLSRMASWLTRLTAGDHQFTTAELDTIVQFCYAEIKHNSITPPIAQAA